MKPEHLHILQHSLGLDEFAKGSWYRNRFVTEPTSSDGILCQELCSLGLMKDYGSNNLIGEMHTYCVTEKGMDECVKNSKAPPKLSRGQKRYKQYLKSDCGLSFIDWLRTHTPLNRSK